mgnify:CR=1 FL=1
MIKIALCAFNETQSLEKLLTNISHELQNLKENFEIIICLDGTTDNSAEIIKKFNSTSILPLRNERGLGLAFKRVFLEIIKNSTDEDLVISLDADNTHDARQFTQMLKYFNDNNLDILVASRFSNKSISKSFPKYRQLISKSVSIVLQTLFPIKKINGLKLQDYTSGYRIYKAKKLKELFKLQQDNFITEPEFTYTCELLIKLSRIDCRIDETAIFYNYDEKIGVSKLRITRNFLRLVALIGKLFYNKKL